jgi:hypothetical protein
MLYKILFFIFFATIASESLSLDTVYILPKYQTIAYYNGHLKDFFSLMFPQDKFEVIMIKSLENLSNYRFLITDEVPREKSQLEILSTYPKERNLLFSFETQISHPESHDKKYHKNYSRVFTWNDDLVDNEKYFKVRYPFMDPRPMIEGLPAFQQRKLCVLVGNIFGYPHPLANYQERKRIIEFFEANTTKPGDFTFYGFKKALSPYTSSKNYGGAIAFTDRRSAKIQTIKHYKFDLCYENTVGVNGWISERIFESFAAGCIPIYMGSENVTHYIPQNCFINRNEFENNEELYSFMKNFTEKKYNEYISNIRKFLASENAFRLSTAYYVKHIREVLDIA